LQMAEHQVSDRPAPHGEDVPGVIPGPRR